MARIHRVEPGESLYSIARQHGFACWQALYEHAENAGLRARRPNPQVLHPGDEVALPEACPGGAPVPLDRESVIERRRRGWQPLRMRVTDQDGAPLARQPFTVSCGPHELQGETDQRGLLSVELPVGALEAVLKVGAEGEHELSLRIGELNPLELDTGDGGVSGCQARLNSLGYRAGASDGVLGAQTEEALRCFQQDEGLEETGRLDDATRRAMQRRHGS